MAVPECNGSEWAQLDAAVAAQLANSKRFCDHSSAKLFDEVFTVVRQTLDGKENGSVLLLGEAGSGKTHLVEQCVQRLEEVPMKQSLTVLRAYGGAYASDVECVRHLASQATGQVVAPPKGNASFERGLEWIRETLAAGLKHTSAVLIILERFEHFCSRARQTLLYNLFDLAQEMRVRLCIVGTSEKLDVLSMLEKRIQSRFSMRHLHTFLPSTMKELIEVLKAKLLPDRTVKQANSAEFKKRLEDALWEKSKQWKRPLELGRPITWFLGQCLPLSSLLQAASSSGLPCAKRARTAPSAEVASTVGARAPLLAGLAEVEHLVMLAMFKMSQRHGQGSTATLSAILNELQRLHDSGGVGTRPFNADHYCAAFDRLLQARLVELHRGAASDLGKLHTPCKSLVNHHYKELVQDLHRTGALTLSNPLRALPQPVQQWIAWHQRD